MKEKIGEIAKKISKLDSTEINELTEKLLTEHNISATIYHFGIVPMIDFNQEIVCDLYLVDAGYSKLGTIKYIKELLNLGLKEAKDIIENTPILLIEDIPINNAELIIKGLKEYGATAKMNK